MAKTQKTIKVYGLMKIGQGKHIDELQNEGKIFCNTISYFREWEKKDKNRHDDREGAFKTELLNPDNLKISVEGMKLPIKFTYARFNQFDKSKDECKLYCMYGFKKKNITGEPFIDKRNVEFGSKALIITNTEEFVKRIKSKLKEMGLKYSYDYVSYYEEDTINDQLSVFHKPLGFNYQSEFRFFINETDSESLVIRIGSIEDISLIIDPSKLPKLRLKPL